MANEFKLGSPLIVNANTTLNRLLTVSPQIDSRILDLQQFSASPATTSNYITFKDNMGSTVAFVNYLGSFLSADGDAVTPGHGFRNQTGIGVYRAGSSILAFSTASSERMRISATGNVGIGTSAPGDKLDVGNGNIRILNNGFLKLSDTQGTPNFISIQAPTTVTSNYTWILPAAQGGASTVLSNNGSGTLSWVSVPTGVTGDINQTTFAPANNQAAATNITGLAFANASVQSARVQYSVVVNATTSLYESGTLQLIQKGSGWEMSQSKVGDDIQMEFTVTSSGQVQYTSANYAGFSSAKMQFRATVTSV